MQMQLEGQEIVYKDLPDLKDKLTALVAKMTAERESHEQEAKRLRRQEKKLRAFLGESTESQPAISESMERQEAPANGAAHE